jgi:calcineurin-like phosphoesterase family protein
MNEALIHNWNSKVTADDSGYIVGDIFPCKPKDGDVEQVLKIIEKLNGRKTLLLGNHDDAFVEEIRRASVFLEVCQIKQITDGERKVTLCHYPLMSWPDDDKGSFHLYGHIHNKELPDIFHYYKERNAFNVGCDVNDFSPKNLTDLIGGQKKCT